MKVYRELINVLKETLLRAETWQKNRVGMVTLLTVSTEDGNVAFQIAQTNFKTELAYLQKLEGWRDGVSGLLSPLFIFFSNFFLSELSPSKFYFFPNLLLLLLLLLRSCLSIITNTAVFVSTVSLHSSAAPEAKIPPCNIAGIFCCQIFVAKTSLKFFIGVVSNLEFLLGVLGAGLRQRWSGSVVLRKMHQLVVVDF